MQEATLKTTPSARRAKSGGISLDIQPPAPPVSPAAPSITEFGFMLASARADYSRLDEYSVKPPKPQDGRAMDLLYAREHALRQIISMYPAETLMDTAVQLGVAYHAAADL